MNKRSVPNGIEVGEQFSSKYPEPSVTSETAVCGDVNLVSVLSSGSNSYFNTLEKTINRASPIGKINSEKVGIERPDTFPLES